jgi:hypothetical protein
MKMSIRKAHWEGCISDLSGLFEQMGPDADSVIRKDLRNLIRRSAGQKKAKYAYKIVVNIVWSPETGIDSGQSTVAYL